MDPSPLSPLPVLRCGGSGAIESEQQGYSEPLGVQMRSRVLRFITSLRKLIELMILTTMVVVSGDGEDPGLW